MDFSFLAYMWVSLLSIALHPENIALTTGTNKSVFPHIVHVHVVFKYLELFNRQSYKKVSKSTVY